MDEWDFIHLCMFYSCPWMQIASSLQSALFSTLSQTNGKKVPNIQHQGLFLPPIDQKATRNLSLKKT